jgi:hypothetical protein
MEFQFNDLHHLDCKFISQEHQAPQKWRVVVDTNVGAGSNVTMFANSLYFEMYRWMVSEGDCSSNNIWA